MIKQHLPVLQVVIPLIAAPLCVLLRRSSLVWLFTLIVTWVSFAISGSLLWRVLEEGKAIVYSMGGWSAPFGIEYRIDEVNAFVLLIITGLGAVVLPYAFRSVRHEIPYEKHYLFYATFLLCYTGLLGITITGDAFNVFVFLEISSLSSYVLISMGKNRKALTSAFQYLIMGTIGGTFILIGIGLMYMVTGTLNMTDLAARLMPIHDSRTVLVAFAFLSVGISIKLALFPLHIWLPNAYTEAPSMVTSFIAATSTKVSFYMLLRFMLTIFGPEFSHKTMQLDVLLLPLSLIAIVVASTVAIFQRNIKRMLAYSSVAQIGYMVLGLSFFSVEGLTGSIVHLFNHALMKGALFMALGCMFLRLGSVHLDELRGVGRRMPWTTMAFVFGGLGMIGVPLTVGFVSKWYLITASMKQGSWLVTFLILLSSLLAVIYIWRVIEVAYFQEPPEGAIAVREAPLSMLLPTWFMIGASVYFGIFTDTSVGVAARAAKMLLGVTP